MELLQKRKNEPSQKCQNYRLRFSPIILEILIEL
jgi:hypothetical protein